MKFIACLLLLICFIKAFAQHPFHYSISDEQGLPSNEVYDMLQDKKGFIWLGTSAGLYKYDGKTFQKFNNKKQNSRGISHLILDNAEKLWCQNFTGQIFFVENDSLHLLLDRSSAQANFPLFTIDRQSRLYVSSDTGIYVFEKNAQKDFWYLNKNEETDIRCIFTDLLKADNKLYFAERKGIGYFENSKPQFIITTNKKNRFNDVLQQSFLYHTHGKILLLSHGEKQHSIWQIRNDSLVWLLDLPQKLGRVFSLHDDGNGIIWAGGSNGALCFNYKLEPQFNGKLFFPQKSISKVLLDKEGNYWFATLQDGIFVIPSLEVWIYNEENAALPDTRIRKLTSDETQTLFIGTQNGKVAKLNVADYTMQHISFPHSPKEIQEMFFHKPYHQLMVGQNNSWLVNTKDMSVKQIFDDINLKAITHISVDTFFLGSVHQAYLAKWDNQFSRIATMRNKRVRCAYYDADAKRLWVGYADGLLVYENLKEKEILFDNEKIFAADIVQTNDGNIWIGTVNKGVLQFSDTQFQQQLNENIGIQNSFVRNIEADNHNLWIAAEHHLIRYNFKTQSADYFNLLDGLPSPEIADMKIVGNKIFLATPKGLVQFPVSANPKNHVPPNIFIDAFGILEKDTALHASYILAFAQNNIYIRFTGIAFRSRGNLSYQYRMIGLDTTWVTTDGSSNFARYQSLPAGKYSFEVKAVNEDGTESETPAVIDIEILPPYWQRWWFYLLVFLAFGGIISFFYLLRIRYLNKRNELEKRIANSQLAALKAQMNPHFMFNALSSIQDLVLQQKTEKAQWYLGKFSNLTRKVLEASGNEFITLEKEVEMLTLYLELESLRFEGELLFKLVVDEEMDSDEIKIPSMIIQPYVENALKHGLLHKKGKKFLHLSFVKKENLLECVIDDNGIGRAVAETIYKRNKKHSSFATRATEERLKLLREYYKLEVDLEIIDKYKDEVSAGTKVIIKIPLN